VKVAEFLHQAVTIALRLQESNKTMKEFEAAVKADAHVKALKIAVQTYITQYPMPGFDVSSMRYKSIEA
jgi:hypothetical protein